MSISAESALERGISLRAAKERADAKECTAFRTCLETPGEENQHRWAEALKAQSAVEESYRAWRTTYLF